LIVCKQGVQQQTFLQHDRKLQPQVTDHNDKHVFQTGETYVSGGINRRLSQRTLWFKVPAGTQSGKIFKLSGKGIVALQGYGRGDELVVLRVEVPTKMNARQKELLEEFAKAGGEEIHPQGKGFFDKVKELFD